MATTLTTGGSVNLNNATNYWLLAFDLGKPNRDEVWLQPKVRGSTAILAGYVDAPVQMTISLRVQGSSTADLLTKLNVVRDEFNTVANTLVWTPNGGTARTYTTYASPIDPIDLDNLGAGMTLGLAVQQFMVPSWTFQVWRQPYSSADSALFKQPTFG